MAILSVGDTMEQAGSRLGDGGACGQRGLTGERSSPGSGADGGIQVLVCIRL